MSRFEDMVAGLQQDTEIPLDVWTKYTKTLEALPERGYAKSRTKAYRTETCNGIRYDRVQERCRTRRRCWPVAAAAILAVGAVSASAAYLQWSRSLSDGLQATDTQKQLLEENQMAAFLDQSVTQNGVTVTAQQSIVDNQYAYLSFKVEGYTPEADLQPGFADVEVTVGDEEDASSSGYSGYTSSFYDGLVAGADGIAVHTDGTPVSEDDFYRYIQEDGSLEYEILLMNDQKGYFLNQPVHVEFRDLGTYPGKAEAVTAEVEGTWSFDWTLQGSDEMTTYKLNAPLEDHQTTVLEAEISPISFRITYDFPKQEAAEPPYFTGVQLKDGTIYTGINGAGYEGYSNENPNIYESTGAFTRIIDVDQIENLLFIRSYPEDGQALTEENLYFVPVS
jgi:hypothetical protein